MLFYVSYWVILASVIALMAYIHNSLDFPLKVKLIFTFHWIFFENQTYFEGEIKLLLILGLSRFSSHG
jgi:hypothetical protein